ncbi:hypothetical protein DFQ26_002564 [Actinomortierella ambigua]|nr:hypothetical protein DFQ26_002564 [Actinomortierella ambigua]
MDRTTGKTQKTAFVELALTSEQAVQVARIRNHRGLKGRVVSVVATTQDELLGVLFPRWPGKWIDGEPVPLKRSVCVVHMEGGCGCRAGLSHKAICYLDRGHDVDHQTASKLPTVPSDSHEPQHKNPEDSLQAPPESRLMAFSNDPATPPFINREEVSSILLVCRNFKLHFSRKCAERPYENILSIVCKYPWHRPELIIPLHRDHVFELMKLAVEALRGHLSKDYHPIHPTLMERMIRCAVLTPAFTEKQKTVILRVAGCPCPEDLIPWLAPLPSMTEPDEPLQPTVDNEDDRLLDTWIPIVQERSLSQEGVAAGDEEAVPLASCHQGERRAEEQVTTEKEVDDATSAMNALTLIEQPGPGFVSENVSVGSTELNGKSPVCTTGPCNANVDPPAFNAPKLQEDANTSVNDPQMMVSASVDNKPASTATVTSNAYQELSPDMAPAHLMPHTTSSLRMSQKPSDQAPCYASVTARSLSSSSMALYQPMLSSMISDATGTPTTDCTRSCHHAMAPSVATTGLRLGMTSLSGRARTFSPPCTAAHATATPATTITTTTTTTTTPARNSVWAKPTLPHPKHLVHPPLTTPPLSNEALLWKIQYLTHGMPRLQRSLPLMD